MSLRSIRKELATLERKYDVVSLKYQLDKQVIKNKYQNLYFTCKACKARTQLKNVILIIDHWYSENYEFYQESGTNFILCTKCFVLNRYMSKEAVENLVLEECAYKDKIQHHPINGYNQNHMRKKHKVNGQEFCIETLRFVNV